MPRILSKWLLLCLLLPTVVFAGGINPNQIQNYNNLFTGRNVIVNGGNEFAQVNGTTGLTGVTNGAYAVDNSMYYASSVAAVNEAQSSVSPADSFSALGSTFKLLITSTASHTVVAGDISAQSLPVEGFNFARFHWGGANALPASLSFGVTCSIAGTNTYSGSIQNYARTRSYPFTYSCTGAAAAARIIIQNIPGDTTGTWVGATNAGAAYVNFDLGSGSTYQAAAGAWTGTGTGNFLAASGVSTKQIDATSGATLAITDAQLEQSTFVTTYERKLYDQVLREVQRYLPYWTGGGFSGYTYANNSAVYFATNPVPTRVPISGLTASPDWSAYAFNVTTTVTPIILSTACGLTTTGFAATLTLTAGSPSRLSSGSFIYGTGAQI